MLSPELPAPVVGGSTALAVGENELVPVPGVEVVGAELVGEVVEVTVLVGGPNMAMAIAVTEAWSAAFAEPQS